MRMGLGLGLGYSQAGAAQAIKNAVDLGVLLAGLVERHEKTADGDRITLIMPAWRAILGVVTNDRNALFNIAWRDLEKLIAAKYDAEGYDTVILTPRKGDHGRDVIAEKHGSKVRIFDQVKAYGKGKLVPADDVRALMGVVAHSDATKGVVTTTSDFAPLLRQDPFIKNAIDGGLELVNGDKLLKRLRELKQK